MAVIVTDTRTTLDDANTAGAPPTGWNTGEALTTVFAEGATSIIETFNITTGQVFFTTGTSIDVSDTLVYVWSNNFALQDVWDAAAPPNALLLGDGTDQVSFKMAGVNRKVFAHLDAGTGITVDWDCLVLDGSQAATMDTAGDTVELAGTFAALDLTAITQVGSDFTTLSKGIGGGVNVATDIIRYGNGGLRVTGGTTGGRGDFLEIVAEDQSSANGKAHGIIRALSTGVYGVQGPLQFGDTVSTATSWFQDEGVTIVFENRNISDDKYFISLGGNTTGETHFLLDNVSITTAGPAVRVAMSGTNVDELSVTNTQFNNLAGIIEFGTDGSAASHVVQGCTFVGCDQIDPQVVSFKSNTIIGSVSSSAALRIVSASGANTMSDLSFERGTPTAHAIILASGSPSTLTLDNFVFTGYGLDETSTSSVFNSSGAAITLSIVNGASPTVRNGTGSSTIVENNVLVTFTSLVTGTEIRVYTAGTLTEIAGQENIVSGSFQFSTGAGSFVDIRIFAVDYLPVDFFSFEIPTTSTSLPLQQIFDRNYNNP
jgi:hypothetical protein